MPLPPTPPLYNSPKRKRGEQSPSYSPAASPAILRTTTSRSDFPSVAGGAAGNKTDGTASPQNVVAYHFKDLRIHGSRLERTDGGHPPKRTALADVDIDNTYPSEHCQPDWTETGMSTTSDAIVPPSSPTFHFAANTISDPVPEVSRRTSRSPPIDGARQENFWHESEITGYDATDPNDDGYGINGIGFKPTSSAAWARSQRRKQQLADYKSREAREARQKRSERRRIASFEAATHGDSAVVSKKPTRVRFDAG